MIKELDIDKDMKMFDEYMIIKGNAGDHKVLQIAIKLVAEKLNVVIGTLNQIIYPER